MKPAASRLGSWLLLAGIAAGFLLACGEGHRAAAYSKPRAFTRFHQRISPDAGFYPPYAMLEALALARWAPGKTLVIIGGNSILNGVAQPESEVWSLRLQEMLGDPYVVVNLAFRGSMAAQGGALVAESLQRRGYPVIFVANTYPHAGCGRAADGPYGYFYWQALHQGKLSDYPARTADLQRWRTARPEAERIKLAETELGARIEAVTRAQSLWVHVSYRHLFTVWNFILGRDFWRPRVWAPDNEPAAPPVEERFRHEPEAELATVRGFTETLYVPGPSGSPQLDPAWPTRLGDEIEAAFVPTLRPRMLMLLSQSAPPYLERLTPAERSRNRAAYAAAARIWRDHGINAIVAGDGFAASDYFDRLHLTGEGGRKVAALVAEQITQMNSD